MSSNTSSIDDQLLEFPEFRAQRLLALGVPPALILLGTIGNCLSFWVLTSKAMRRHSTCAYLSVLCVADTLVLWFGLFRMWLVALTGQSISSDWFCKLATLSSYSSSHFAVWLIVAVTTERYVVVCLPLRAYNFCQAWRALKVAACLLVAAVAFNLHFVWTVAVSTYRHAGHQRLQCDYADGYEYLVVQVWPWVDAFAYSFGPFVAILLLNISIIRQIIQAGRMRSRTSSVSSSALAERRSETTSYRLTAMLLSISFCFLFTTLPCFIFFVVKAVLSSRLQHEIDLVAKVHLLQTATQLLMHLNHACNFFLYCATGQRFRSHLLGLVSRVKLRPRIVGSRSRSWLRSPSSNPRPLLLPLKQDYCDYTPGLRRVGPSGQRNGEQRL